MILAESVYLDDIKLAQISRWFASVCLFRWYCQSVFIQMILLWANYIVDRAPVFIQIILPQTIYPDDIAWGCLARWYCLRLNIQIILPQPKYADDIAAACSSKWYCLGLNVQMVWPQSVDPDGTVPTCVSRCYDLVWVSRWYCLSMCIQLQPVHSDDNDAACLSRCQRLSLRKSYSKPKNNLSAIQTLFELNRVRHIKRRNVPTRSDNCCIAIGHSNIY